ncbi:hypothetical protein TNCV_2402011 [Trichonephila clavipes]|nr:hypothetical protein TNCV_2402011 [Trichonephila clavipes]
MLTYRAEGQDVPGTQMKGRVASSQTKSIQRHLPENAIKRNHTETTDRSFEEPTSAIPRPHIIGATGLLPTSFCDELSKIQIQNKSPHTCLEAHRPAVRSGIYCRAACHLVKVMQTYNSSLSFKAKDTPHNRNSGAYPLPGAEMDCTVKAPLWRSNDSEGESSTGCKQSSCHLAVAAILFFAQTRAIVSALTLSGAMRAGI